jgi:LacI family transcriptional regulator
MTKDSKISNLKRTSSVPTISDVARIAGVGAITVSRFVNGTSYVSVEKQKIIRAAIKKLGYRPNLAARVLKGQRAKIIGLIIPDLADPFYGKCASAVEDFASEQGYMTLIVASKRDRNLQEKELAMLLGQQVAGMIIVASVPSGFLRQFADSNIPIVGLDQPIRSVPADEVVVENLDGSHVAVDHLIAHGHKRIACVGYDKTTYAIGLRILGYRNTMQLANLKPEVYEDTETLEDTLRIVRQWKKSASRPTAVFSLNNVSTRLLLHALREVDLAIPKDIALIGFDDFEMASLLTPTVTVVRQPAIELGTQAARLLFERIAATNMPAASLGVKIVLPVEFVIRASCGCPAVTH